MGLKAKLDTLDGLEAQYHDLYEEIGGVFVLKPIEGLKPQEEFDRVHRGLASERENHRQTKAIIKDLETAGIKTPADVEALRQQVTTLEAALADSADGAKLDALVSQRTRAATAPLERELTQLRGLNSEFTKTIETLKAKETFSVIRDAVTVAARKEKVLDSALEDALFIAEATFEIDSAGNVVTRDVRGQTPGLSPEAWLGDLRVKKPHWWPQSQGGGAAGGGGGGVGGPNPWSKSEWNLTKQGEIIRADRAKAERLAKQAGSHVGATKPPEK